MVQKLSALNFINVERHKLVTNSTLFGLQDGKYDLINRIYYQQLNHLLKNSLYELLGEFYEQRDQRIADNIIEIMKNNKGRKMIFLLGADHRDFTIKEVTRVFRNQIILNNLNR